MSTGARRQQRLKEKRREAGQQLMRFWVSENDIEALKHRYPGPRGGINWPGVVAAALGPTRSPQKVNPLAPNDAIAEPFPYWKPGGPFTPMDERCQARNRDGSRCKSKGKVIVQTLAPNGHLGEFNACERHRDGFQPHPGVLTIEMGGSV